MIAKGPRHGFILAGILVTGLLVRLIVAATFFGSLDIEIQIADGSRILAGESAWTSKLPIGYFLPAAMQWMSERWGIPAPFAQKLPAIVADLLVAALLYRIAGRRGASRPWVWPAVYMLNPLTVMLSSYHGNIDGLMAGAILWALDLRTRERPVLAGISAGSAILMKPTALLALPVLMLPLSRWRNWTLGIVAVLLCVAVCAPFAILDPMFGEFLAGYSGPYGLWGVSYGFRQLEYIAERALPSQPDVISGLHSLNTLLEANSQLFVASMMAAWFLYLLFRWKLDGFDENARGIAAAYLFFYVITTGFGVQYLGLAFPFILIVSTRLAVTYALALSPHVFDTYVQVAGNETARAVAARLTSDTSGDFALGVARMLFMLVAWLACVWILWRLVRTREVAPATS